MGDKDTSDSTVLMKTTRDGEVFTEILRTQSLGRNQYQLLSSPFYALDISIGDIVRATKVSGQCEFKKVITKSGTCTVRLRFLDDIMPDDENDKIIKALRSFGCQVDSLTPRFYSVNIPITLRLEAITSFLKDCDVPWECGDPSLKADGFQTGLKKMIASRFKWRP
jgi:hypothetical protein